MHKRSLTKVAALALAFAFPGLAAAAPIVTVGDSGGIKGTFVVSVGDSGGVKGLGPLLTFIGDTGGVHGLESFFVSIGDTGGIKGLDAALAALAGTQGTGCRDITFFIGDTGGIKGIEVTSGDCGGGAPVPEPASIALVTVGLSMLAARARRR